MGLTLDPLLGHVNPLLGLRVKYPDLMPRGPKTKKVPGFMRAVVAQNLDALIAKHYPPPGDANRALAKAAGCSLSTIQRARGQVSGASIDTLEAIAGCFNLSAYQLLLPDLDVDNPQVVQGASKAEEEMFRRWRKHVINQSDKVKA